MNMGQDIVERANAFNRAMLPDLLRDAVSDLLHDLVLEVQELRAEVVAREELAKAEILRLHNLMDEGNEKIDMERAKHVSALRSADALVGQLIATNADLRAQLDTATEKCKELDAEVQGIKDALHLPDGYTSPDAHRTFYCIDCNAPLKSQEEQDTAFMSGDKDDPCPVCGYYSGMEVDGDDNPVTD